VISIVISIGISIWGIWGIWMIRSLVTWSLVTWSLVTWSLVTWSLVTWSLVTWSLVTWSLVEEALVMQQRHLVKTAMDADVIAVAGLAIQPVNILGDQPRPGRATSRATR
jgi:hypothetical protein